MPEEINFSFNFGGKTLKVKTENELEFGFEFSLLKSFIPFKIGPNLRH